MSWHFLERWIEKANHHSTLVGKFWITFLIVCRMVIVASVGDRVYSDEQSEFKCNTLQPGCTNVCFNKFSPISHLRFWSFQILLVATPSVMFIVYSGHDQKKTKPAGKGKKSKKKATLQALAKRQDKMPKGGSGGEVKVNWNTNANNNNACDNRNKKSSDKSPGKVSTRSSGRDNNNENGSGGRNGRSKGLKDGDSGSITQAPQVLATLINYKNGGGRSPVEAAVMDDNNTGRKELNVPWQEMRWNSLMHITENGSKNNKNTMSRNMWKKPKDRSRSKDRSEDRYKNALNADIVVWGPPSSDDDNRNGKYRKVNQSSLTEADMYQNGMMAQDFDKEHELAMLNAQSPPEYPGNEQSQWAQNDRDQKYQEEMIRKYQKGRDGFNFPQLEIVKTRTKKARFTRHFHLYLLSVFARLVLEVGFLVGQIMLYGFTVPALYKCEQWPCPNMVDCFISRPMEKTIFLYFMLIYTCICVLLNACEFKYLVWVYIFGRPKLMAKINSFDCRNEEHIIYDANGEPKYSTRFLEQDSEFDECDFAEIGDEEFETLMQNGYGTQNGFKENGFARKQAYTRTGKLNSKLRARQEKMAEMRHHELDLILNAEEMQDDYDYDMGQTDPVEDMAQMEMAAAAVGGGGSGDDFNC
uniref:uncharacterized protein LOC120326464 n=1 Tax=Styela clava TaxID=7725 RepID=UPI00193AA265|nr:uncharacterized protein LOC120326464 [Styela clava]